jgi:hypothetical protein
MTAGIYNGWIIYEGATFQEILRFKSGCELLDISDWTFTMTIASRKDVDGVLFTLTLGNGIELIESGTAIEITLTDTQTATIAPASLVYQLDVELPSGEIQRRLIGDISIVRDLA